MKKITIKQVALAILFSLTLSTTTFAGKVSETNNDVTLTGQYCGVFEDEIRMYMTAHGYQVLCIMPIPGSCDAMVKTTNPYLTRVFIIEGAIIGHENDEI